jgi:hypothetical protein
MRENFVKPLDWHLSSSTARGDQPNDRPQCSTPIRNHLPHSYSKPHSAALVPDSVGLPLRIYESQGNHGTNHRADYVNPGGVHVDAYQIGGERPDGVHRGTADGSGLESGQGKVPPTARPPFEPMSRVPEAIPMMELARPVVKSTSIMRASSSFTSYPGIVAPRRAILPNITRRKHHGIDSDCNVR